MFEILHFNGAEQVIKKKKMENEILSITQYIDDALYGTLSKGLLLKQALSDVDWRQESNSILEGRRYYYKGFRNGIAIDGSFAAYEYVLEGLFRLQIGFDKGKIDSGILLLTSQRSEKSPYGDTKKLVKQEMELLQPTISVPVTVILFDLGKPGMLYSEEGAQVKPGKDDKDLSDKSVNDLPDIKKSKPGLTIKPVEQPDISDKSKGKRISKKKSRSKE